MNFFGHATLAAAVEPRPGFVFGAMLPDLLGMLGVHGPAGCDPAVARGMAFHVRTDAVFHASETFTRLAREGRAVLSSAEVRRGPSLAAAHVGIELLLDGALGRDEGRIDHYRDALDRRPPLAWTQASDGQAVDALCERLLSTPVPAVYRDPEGVAERVIAVLSRRPRLRMLPHEEAALLPWLTATRERVEHEAEPWRAALERALVGSSP